MRIIALGDTHGRTSWKKITAHEEFDKVVFIGYYFDTHEDVSGEQQKENFKNIVQFKKLNIEKVVLLFGNHDYHYLRTVNEAYSGYQEWERADIQDLLHPAIDDNLLQMCFVWQNLLFSHAGVTKTWCDNNRVQKDYLEQSINELFKYSSDSFSFTRGINCSMSGDDVEQSPIWVRPNSLLKDRMEGFIQVVGHTIQGKLVIADDVIFIDTLGTSGEYLIWDNFQLASGKKVFKN